MAMNSIQEFDGTNREVIIPWLDHVKAIARKTGFHKGAVWLVMVSV